MTILRITDITAPGAYCNAMAAANESDRRYLQRMNRVQIDSVPSETVGASVAKVETGWRAAFKKACCILRECFRSGSSAVHASVREHRAL